MTMEHRARSFKVTSLVIHPNIDPTEISKVLELTPKRATRAGAPRTTPTGTAPTGVYKLSCWTHRFDVKEASELTVLLEDVVQRLQKHQEFFHRVVREGGSVELFCGVFAAGNWDEILSHSLLGKLAALQVDLRLDVYPDHANAG